MHIKLEKNQRKSAKRAQHIFTVNFKRQLGYFKQTAINVANKLKTYTTQDSSS